MRAIKTYTFISIDGYITRSNGDIDWMQEYQNPYEKNSDFISFTDTANCVLINNILYDSLVNYHRLWPFEGKQCYVVSNKNISIPPDKNIKLIRTDTFNITSFLPILERIREDSGCNDIWVAGSQTLVSLLMNHEMIDEITLVIIPKTIGSGIPFGLPHCNEQQWSLIDVYRYPNDTVKLKYIKKTPKQEELLS